MITSFTDVKIHVRGDGSGELGARQLLDGEAAAASRVDDRRLQKSERKQNKNLSHLKDTRRTTGAFVVSLVISPNESHFSFSKDAVCRRFILWHNGRSPRCINIQSVSHGTQLIFHTLIRVQKENQKCFTQFVKRRRRLALSQKLIEIFESSERD